MDKKPKSPRTSRSTRAANKTKAKDKLSREQLLLALEKKKQCNATALAIVERLIDPVANAADFLPHLSLINQCHYDDIVEERSIISTCGYPLCQQPLQDVPNKQYHISRATNKIYDITERKKFCSTHCFRASNYIREQLLTSPLWLRDHEEIPTFQLMNSPASSSDDPLCSQMAQMDLTATTTSSDPLSTQMAQLNLTATNPIEAMSTLSLDEKFGKQIDAKLTDLYES